MTVKKIKLQGIKFEINSNFVTLYHICTEFVILLTRLFESQHLLSKIKGLHGVLKDKRYEIEAPIADAEYILLNEVDKCNSGIRNTMLSLMRERTLFFGDKIIPCKWKILAASCNEIPDDETDNPFWDRFVLTYKVERVGIEGIVNYWKDMKIVLVPN